MESLVPAGSRDAIEIATLSSADLPLSMAASADFLFA
jgi:hypothetical protein